MEDYNNMESESVLKQLRQREVDLASVARMFVAVGVVLMAVGLPLMAVNASAGQISSWTSNAGILFGLGLVIALVGAVLYFSDTSEKWGMAILVIGLLVAVVGLGGWLIAFFAPANGGTPFDDLPPPPPGYSADWECRPMTLATGGPGGAHDGVTEFPDTPFVNADAGTPDLNKVIHVATLDLQNRRFYFDVAIDDDLASTAAAFIATDTFSQDINCRLLNPTPAVGGGLQEIPFWGRMSVSRVSGTRDNGSYVPVFYCDVTAGHYLGFGLNADSGAAADGHDADHSYVSYTDANVCPAPPPTVGDWKPLGTSDGDADGEWVAAWHILDLGLSDFTAPPIGSSVDVLIEIGTRPGDSTYKGDLSTNTMSIRIDTRT